MDPNHVAVKKEPNIAKVQRETYTENRPTLSFYNWLEE